MAETCGECDGILTQHVDTAAYIRESEHFRWNRVCAGYCRYGSSDVRASDRIFGCHNIISEDNCACGIDKAAHSNRAAIGDRHGAPDFGVAGRWCTRVNKDRLNTSFGELHFSSLSNNIANASRSQFLRLRDFSSFSPDSPGLLAYQEAIFRLLFNYWKMPKPRLVIEVAGSVRNTPVDSNPQVAESIKTDVVEAAGHSRAWLVTSGENGGIMRLIGDAVAQYNCLFHGARQRIACLAVSNWHDVISDSDNRQAIEAADGEARRYSADDVKNSGTLNHGHNYALIVDNGRLNGFGDSIYFRHELTNYIAQKVGHENGSINAAIPVVLLAAGGGPGTLATIEQCLGFGKSRCAFAKPIVIYYGFGGVTDLIADALADHQMNSGGQLNLSDSVRCYMKKHLPRIGIDSKSHVIDQSYVDEIVRRIVLCLQKTIETKQITIYKMGSSLKLSETIEKSAISFYACDGVRDLIERLEAGKADTSVTNLNESVRLLFPICLPYVAHAHGQAYANNAIEQIVNILQAGKDAGDRSVAMVGVLRENAFITLKVALRWNLPMLADELLSSRESNILARLSSDGLQKAKIVADVVGRGNLAFLKLLVKHRLVLGDQFLSHSDAVYIYENALRKLANIYGPKVRSLRQLGEAFDQDIGCFAVDILFQVVSSKISEADCSIGVDHRNVFLLQLALGHVDMADYLLKTGSEPLGSALLASQFLKGLVARVRQMGKKGYTSFRESENLALEYADQAIAWEGRAYRLLDECSNLRKDKLQEQLNRRLTTWQDLSVFEIVTYGKCRLFASHEAVFTQMKFLLFENISPYNNSFFFLLAVLFPPIFAPLLTFIPFATKSLSCCATRVATGSPNKSQQKPGYFDYLKEFLSAPAVKLIYHVISMFCYILLFSAFVLENNLDPKGVTFHEALVLAWSGAALLDDVYDTYADDAEILIRRRDLESSKKLSAFFRTVVWDRINLFHMDKAYFNNASMRLIGGSLLIAAFTMRLTLEPADFVYPHTCYTLVCLLLWLRSISILKFWPTTGQIVAILFEMVPVLALFLLIYILLLLSFAIPIYSLTAASFGENIGENSFLSAAVFFNSSSEATSDGHNISTTESLSLHDRVRSFFKLFAKVVYNRWWNLVQVGLDDSRKAVEGVCDAKCDHCETTPFTALDYDCTTTEFNFVAIVLFIVFIFLTNIVWMNVLIATLSDRVTSRRKATTEQSRFHFFVSVRTLYYRTYLPVPINLLEIAIRLLRFAITGSVILPTPNGDSFNYKYQDDEQIRLDELERQCAAKVLARSDAEKIKSGNN